MTPPWASRAVALLTLTLLGPGCASMSAGPAPVNVDEANEVAVAKWLTLHPQYRLATDADCHCADELASIRAPGPSTSRPNYYPYLAHGDSCNSRWHC